jgi:para-nitrobenzyl esterase
MNMPNRIAAPIALGLAVLTLACAPAALAQVHRSNPGDADAKTVLDTMPGKGKLTVATPAFKSGEQIPFENTQYRTNTFPGLSWSKGPAGTKSYALIMQDNTLILRGAPILHWTVYTIPASMTSLPVGMTAAPAGVAFGPNYKGAAQPYTGPRTPPGPGDDYHFEIFALDTVLPDPGTDFAGMTKAMEGHVLAAGEVVGHGIADPNAPPPAPRPAAPAPKP